MLSTRDWIYVGGRFKCLDPCKYQEVKDELANIIIYYLSLANSANIDVSRAILDKLRKNEDKYPMDKVKGEYKKYTEL